MKKLYTTKDVADTLGVSVVAVNSWLKITDQSRPPQPFAEFESGQMVRYLWDEKGLGRWKTWYSKRVLTNPYWRANTWHSKDARQAVAASLR